MAITKISILLTLSIFAMATYAWNHLDKSMSYAANRVTTMKMDENKEALQKRKKPTPRPLKPTKKVSARPQSAHHPPDDGAFIASSKRHVDFLKAAEEKRKARWIDLDQITYSPDSFLSPCSNDFLISREAPKEKSSNTDFSRSISEPYPAGGTYLEGHTKSEMFRYLESKKEQILKEIFMGLRFSFTPNGRHLVLEMNVTPSSEKGPGLIIPF